MEPRACPSLIIVGASARAAAESAVRAGWKPWCIDLFADLDLQRIATVIRCPSDTYPEGIVPLVAQAPITPEAPVLFTGAMENHPKVLAAIALHRVLLGCSAATVQKARDPSALASIPPMEGLRTCRILLALPKDTSSDVAEVRYLIKPRRSAGGHGIRYWSTSDSLGTSHYLQEFIPGTAISISYVADTATAVLLGVTEQLIGDLAFGCRAFRYCGSLGPMTLTDRQLVALKYLGVTLAQNFGLHGPFGVDAVLDSHGDIRPVELNPRYTASMELLERATSVRVLNKPAPTVGSVAINDPQTHGKAIVFAIRDVEAPDLYEYFRPDTIADVPAPGQQIPQGQPICTVLANGMDRSETLSRLCDAADAINAQLRA